MSLKLKLPSKSQADAGKAATEAAPAPAPGSQLQASLAHVVVREGFLVSTADDVAKHCVAGAAPTATDLGRDVFVPSDELPAVRAQVAALLQPAAGPAKRDT